MNKSNCVSMIFPFFKDINWQVYNNIIINFWVYVLKTVWLIIPHWWLTLVARHVQRQINTQDYRKPC